MKTIIALSLALLLTVVASAAPVALVNEGAPVAEIVIDPDANQSVVLAAKDLQYYLKEISGAELSIVHAPGANVKNKIFVGESKFTRELGFEPVEFSNSGFEILAKDNYVILSGLDRLSAMSPYSQSHNDMLYQEGRIPKPVDYPSPGLKKWQDFCGEKFTYSDYVNNGGGTFNDDLQIHINDDTGAWYAVSELLEQLGVRFYAPYEDGTIVPELRNVSVPEQHTRTEAAFGQREWFVGRGEADGIAWLKRLKCGNRATVINNHTTYVIFDSVEQRELHPEYLASDAAGRLYSGYPSGAGMPRFGNQDFRRASLVLLRKLFDAFPELTAIRMGSPDGGVKVDARDINRYGKEGDSVEQRASNYLWEYNVFLAAGLKRSHPDKFLIYRAGGGADLVPTNMTDQDPDNIIRSFDDAGPFRVLKVTNNEIVNERRRWRNALKQRGKSPVWDYFLYYRDSRSPRFPIFFTESLQEQAQEMEPYAAGKFIEVNVAAQSNGIQGEAGRRLGEPAIMNLMIYLQSKLFWNPNLDRKALLEEYYRLYFGPAAAEMKEFHEFAEAVWCRQESRSVTETTGFLKPDDVAKYFEILSRARAKAGKDSVYDRRIAAMEAAYQPLKNLFAGLQRKGPLIRAYSVPNGTEVDGDITKYKQGWNKLLVRHSAEVPAVNSTDVCIALSEDRTALYVAAVCHENKMNQVKATTKLNDTFSIFDDDVIEIYVNTPERSYFKVVVNPSGAIWDETTDVSLIERETLAILWNPGTKAVVTRGDDRWTMEVMIPTKDFGKLGPTQQHPWGIQIGRTRFVEGGEENWALAPGLGNYATLNLWGNLWSE